MSRNDRNGYRRRALRKRVKAMGMPCAICGQPIDYDLPALHPMSYELDEIVPVSLGGSELDPDNVQPAHRICNQRKGNKIFYTCEAPGAVESAGQAGKGVHKAKTSQAWDG